MDHAASQTRPMPRDDLALMAYWALAGCVWTAAVLENGWSWAGSALARQGLAVGGIVLLLMVPMLVALLATRFRGWGWVLMGLAAIAGDWLVQNGPVLAPLRGLNWNWQGKALSILATLGFVAWSRSLGPREIGLTAPLRPGWWKPLGLYLVGALAVWILVSHAQRPSWNLEKLAFQATMPGLDEELFTRGLLLALLARAFRPEAGEPERWHGWPIALTCVLFYTGSHRRGCAGPAGGVSLVALADRNLGSDLRGDSRAHRQHLAGRGDP